MNMLDLTIILPFIGFVLLAFSRGRWSENLSATVDIGSIGLAALVTAFVGVDFLPMASRLTASRCGRGCQSATSTSASTWCWTACR